MRTSEIIAIGSELLSPFRLDTNSLWLTDKLNKYGISVTRKHVIGDNRSELSQLLREAMNRSDVVITSGGLGPTFDDITREAFADAAELELEYVEGIYRQMKKVLRLKDTEPAKNNKRQAFVPKGASYVLNPVGTAPGIYWQGEKSLVLLLPGPPGELKGVFSRIERKLFARTSSASVFTRIFKIVAVPESHAEELLQDVEIPANADWSILASIGQVEIHLRVFTKSAEEAESIFSDFEVQLRARIGQRVYGIDDDTLASVAANLLLENKHTIAVAESCTAGWLGKHLTDVDGSSAYMLGGIISYSNKAKQDLLMVPEQLLIDHGAVSAEVALAMAEGARSRLDSDMGVSITGIAGPGGGTDEKPVGTVYIAVSTSDNQLVHRFDFRGSRENIRMQSVYCALDMIRLHYHGLKFESAYVVNE